MFAISWEPGITPFSRQGARVAFNSAVFPSALSGLGSPLSWGPPGVTAQPGWGRGRWQQGQRLGAGCWEDASESHFHPWLAG